MADREFTNINGIKVCDQTARNSIPTKTSQLENDNDYVTTTQLNQAIDNAQLGGGEVDLSGYVTKETGNASQITFADGQTFQVKLDAGTLKGEKGDRGERGLDGADGLTTSISLNGVTYTQENGVITLPNITSGGNVSVEPFDNTTPVIKNKYDLKGKTWNALGDSITAGITSLTQYVDIIANNASMGASKNYGRGGTLISYTGDGYSFLERYPSMNDNVDLITVMGGTNDCLGSITIGNLNDTNNTTFYGALNALIDGLNEKYPNGRIIFITPLKFRSTSAANNTKLTPYAEAIKQACINKNVECIDMHAELTLDDGDYADDTHPNDSGQQKMASYLTTKMQTLKGNIVNIISDDEKVYPVTSTLATYNSNGQLLEDILNDILSRLANLENGTVSIYGNIVVSKEASTISEGGTDTFTVKLDSAPTNEQTVNINIDNSYITVDKTSLTFTSANYNTAQTVTISSQSDSITSNQTSIITLSSLNVNNKTITVSINNSSTSGGDSGGGIEIQPEENMKLYYLASNHGSDDAVFADLSGNNNNGTIEGTNISWGTNGLIFNGKTGKLTLPIKPMENNQNFKLEILLNSITIEPYVFNTVCECLETVTYIGGINIQKGNTDDRIVKIGANSVIYSLDTSTLASSPVKIVIERNSNQVTISVNDEAVKTGNCNTTTSPNNLVFGPGKFELNYIKYYEYQ